MQKGDIVRWDYECWVVGAKPEDNDLVETTREHLAKDYKIFKEGAAYGPAPLIIGTGRLIKGLEASLLAAEPGKEVELSIPPADAYGDRDPKLVEVHSMGEVMRQPEYRKGDEEPVPGAHIVLGNKAGTIMSVRGGRVRIDFNHELAGRTLKYKYVIKAKAEATKEKAEAILEMHYGHPGDFKTEVHGDDIDIVLMEQCKYDPKWLISKLTVVSDLREHAGIAKVRLIEEYLKPAEKKEEKPAVPAEEKPAATPEEKPAGKEEKGAEDKKGEPAAAPAEPKSDQAL